MQQLKAIITDFSKDVELTPEVLVARRARISELAQAMTTVPEGIDMKEYNEGRINHHFSGRVYGRELFLPEGLVVMSKIHRLSTLNTIAMGAVTVISEEGVSDYSGPITFVSKPFTQRLVIVHADTIWVTSHMLSQETTDLEVIENEVIAKDFSELNQISGGN